MRISTNDADALMRMREWLESGDAQRLRERAGLTRRETASVIGVSREAVQKWELGDRSPRGQAALRYARHLDRLAAHRALTP